jgi:hypothetical protein
LINFPENYTPWRSPYENHKSTPKIVKTLEIISINKSYGDLKREQSDYRNWKAAAVANVKSNLYVTSETVKCDLKRHESLTWKSSGSKRFFSSLLFLACGVGVLKERNGGNSIFVFISNYHTSLSLKQGIYNLTLLLYFKIWIQNGVVLQATLLIF